MPLRNKAQIPTCKTCGSDQVNATGLLVWSRYADDWEPLVAFDKGFSCNRCQDDCSIVWVEVDDYENCTDCRRDS